MWILYVVFYDKNDTELYGDLYDKNEKKIIKKNKN
jgi:hypothetical protein